MADLTGILSYCTTCHASSSISSYCVLLVQCSWRFANRHIIIQLNLVSASTLCFVPLTLVGGGEVYQSV